MTNLTATPRDYTPKSELLTNDLFNYLEQSEDSFECLIYKANINSEGHQTDTIEHVGTLEHQETKLTYQSLSKTKAVELKADQEGRSIVAMGDYGSGETDGATFVFQDQTVPEQSIVIVNDKLASGKIITLVYYVLKILPVGKHGEAGKKHVLIAYRGSFHDLLDIDEDDQTDDLDGLVTTIGDE